MFLDGMDLYHRCVQVYSGNFARNLVWQGGNTSQDLGLARELWEDVSPRKQVEVEPGVPASHEKAGMIACAFYRTYFEGH